MDEVFETPVLYVGNGVWEIKHPPGVDLIEDARGDAAQRLADRVRLGKTLVSVTVKVRDHA